MPTQDKPLVTIIGERCRMCYACVRECPAKAIRVADGQASVIQERCIGCGNCLRVCSQNAKHVRDDTERAFALFESGQATAAMLAPSFPAEFVNIEPGRLVGMIRALGFTSVHELSLGADLVAAEYARLLSREPDKRFITTPCPAVQSYVRKYQPQLVTFLAPVVSPMLAMARALRHDFGQDLRVVFVGPCIAKKRATIDPTHAEIDAVLTFSELREMFDHRHLRADAYPPDDAFDPPFGSVGAVFPISGGLLQAAGLQQDLLTGEIVVAEGRGEFVDAINEFDDAHADARLLDVLSCQGCFAGAGMTCTETNLQRRTRISNYAKRRVAELEQAGYRASTTADRYASLDLSRSFTSDVQTTHGPATEAELKAALERMGKHSEADLLNCGACGYESCLAHAEAVCAGLADPDMCLPSAIEHLRAAYSELEESHKSLENAQEALERSTKLASMGQLAAGIAHEVNNPLGTLLLHANLLLEECEQESPLREDLGTIVDQANRCKRIISGLLNFARQSRVVRQPADLAKLVDRVKRTTVWPDNIRVRVDNRMQDPVAEIDSDQMMQVLTNLFSNGQQAMPEGGTLTVNLSDTPGEVVIRIADTGSGVAKDDMPKLFDPFFTTKQVGMGTGLGLAVTHGIVKMHRGQITVESNADLDVGPTGTEFIITLPRHEEKAA